MEILGWVLPQANQTLLGVNPTNGAVVFSLQL